MIGIKSGRFRNLRTDLISKLKPQGFQEWRGNKVGQGAPGSPSPPYGDVGEAEIASGMTVGEPFVVEAEEMENRGVEVVDVDLVPGDGEAEVVGLALEVHEPGCRALEARGHFV